MRCVNLQGTVLQRDIHFKYERANDEEIIYIN